MMESKSEKHPSSAYKRRHSHTRTSGMLSIDVYAQKSRLKCVNSALKLCFSLAVLALCVAADSPLTGALTAAVMLCAVVILGGTPLGYTLSLMKLPIFFICISCAAIAFNISGNPLGFFDIPVSGGYISVTPASAAQAGRLFFKAYGAVSCLYFLSLTTPLQEIINQLKRIHTPDIVIELMYLIYRYIFVLLDVQRKMTVSAYSRLGYSSYTTAWYTFSHISGNLLSSSFRRSGICFDAMESRCYEGNLSFLTREVPVKAQHIAICCACFITLLAITCLLIAV